MEPLLSRLAAQHADIPRDLQLRLYREIGISAVAAALGVTLARTEPRTVAAEPAMRQEAQRHAA